MIMIFGFNLDWLQTRLIKYPWRLEYNDFKEMGGSCDLWFFFFRHVRQLGTALNIRPVQNQNECSDIIITWTPKADLVLLLQPAIAPYFQHRWKLCVSVLFCHARLGHVSFRCEWRNFLGRTSRRKAGSDGKHKMYACARSVCKWPKWRCPGIPCRTLFEYSSSIGGTRRRLEDYSVVSQVSVCFSYFVVLYCVFYTSEDVFV